VLSPLLPSPHEVMEDPSLAFSRPAGPFPPARSTVSVSISEDHDTENEFSAFVSFSSRDMNTAQSVDSMTTQHDVIAPEVTSVTVLGSFRETALIVEAGLTGDYVPARV
jgi:hypothetical protein